jgi:hypothetical protein
MPQQNLWVTESFGIEPQTRFEIALYFPQGARAITKEGKSQAVNICFAVQIRYNDGPQTEAAWFTVPSIIVSGKYKDGFVIKQQYTGKPANQVNTNSINSAYDVARPFSVRIKRLTEQVDVELPAYQQLEDAGQIKYTYYYTSIVQSITGYRANTKPAKDPSADAKLAKTALSVLATKQLNGQIDGINALGHWIKPTIQRLYLDMFLHIQQIHNEY